MPVNARGIKHCVDLALLCTRLTRQNFRGQHAAYAKNSHKKPASQLNISPRCGSKLLGISSPNATAAILCVTRWRDGRRGWVLLHHTGLRQR
jgi:hypothetical protein